MPRYITAFSFTPMTQLKAYVLGFAWADGSVNSYANVLTFVSKDDLSSLRESQIFLTWLYSNVDHIPLLQRKYQKFLDFQKLYQTIIPCFLCSSPISRNGTNTIYCTECNILLRRLTNRRSDHEHRTGIRHLFINLLTDTEKTRINLEALATLG